MQTYWDLSERERAALPRDDVEKYEAAELMRLGVLRVRAPELAPVPSLADVRRRTYFAAKWRTGRWFGGPTVGFRDVEDAQRALTGAVLVEHNHDVGGLIAYDAYELEPVQAISEADAASHKARIKEAAAAEEANRRALEEYEAAKEAQEKALSGMWEDWNECRAKAATMERVRETLEEYTRIAGGDEGVALKFLRRAFKQDDLVAAAEWFGRSFGWEKVGGDSPAPA